MHPFWVVEKPDILSESRNPELFQMKGWIATLDRIDRIECDDPAMASILPISLHSRQDKELSYPNLVITGFESSCAVEHVHGREWIELIFETKKHSFEIIVPVKYVYKDVPWRKKEKLAKIFPRLRCVYCSGRKLARLNDSFDTIIRRIQHARKKRGRGGLLAWLLVTAIRFRGSACLLRLIRKRMLKRKGVEFVKKDYAICLSCNALFPLYKNHFDFLPVSLKNDFGIIETSNVSSNIYDGIAMNYIYKHRNGLILDCGAGLRNKYFENVINYEIVPYDSTDVLGVAEKIPFEDNMFDVIFSFAVLEHVKNPFAVAREMIRVLKPEGILYCQAPFLAPIHGYPHHYFNMSKQGLNSLFEGLVSIERSDILNFGQPVFALSWFIAAYVAGLPAECQQTFCEMKIGDFLESARKHLGSPFVRDLSDETQDILSCVNLIIARKK